MRSTSAADFETNVLSITLCTFVSDSVTLPTVLGIGRDPSSNIPDDDGYTLRVLRITTDPLRSNYLSPTA
jgi:hypothetical protein